MKVALAVTDNMVTEHFGHCDYFVVYEIEDGKAKGSEIIKNPPHQKGFLPNFLHKNGVNCVIAGNMGEMAKKIMDGFGIQVIMGINGEVSDVIAKYLAGELVSSDIICRQHEHHHGEDGNHGNHE
ncbi:MAG TPA: NifB/NifX family molybdenum-iron cluster-binding protein [Bacillota bacterium]|nr:NifB/NifX family molybdenum-iron cluster-binding protein [Bacillota bacterium]HPF41916.1 NifB/NifX family molybdenum-iron cluster-binding protein [Bacillota bacterium]HPJ85611.1 NifB/NifX family molybdenum-iron cluster-binding protein [Bacillota bacterium]HPQ61437.1 NifB/NifX family molybdenum-iron cluster-binding protein [Bacillota bacterium]HRX91325.1 NifB/NifX family molybdenum-iron cluster-binding protein [Candidatus Izemoplasmatales bacterium]